MMETVSVLRLQPQQVAVLSASCAAYRAHLWQAVLPTLKRNQELRVIQALQGRLEKEREHGQAEIALSLTGEERQGLKQLLHGVTQLYGATPSSEQRTKLLGEVTALRALVERTLRQTNTQAL